MDKLYYRDRYQLLIESTTDWLWEIDSNGKYTYCSPQVEKILGYSTHEIVGLTPFDLMPKNEAREIAEKFHSIATNREPIASLRNYNIHRDGHLVLLETSGAPFYDKFGDYAGYRGIDREITAVNSGDDHYLVNRKILDSIDEAVVCILPDGTIKFVNTAFCRLMGYELHELLEQNISLIDSDDSDDSRKAAYAIEELTSKTSIKHKRWRKKKDGALVHVNINAKAILDRNGEVSQLFGIYVEIQKVEELKSLIKEANYSYHELHGSLLEAQRIGKIGGWTLDVETLTVTWSEQLFHMFAMAPIDEIPSYDEQKALFSEDSFKKLDAAIQNTIKTGASYELELNVNRADGKKGWILARGAAIKSDGDVVKKIRGIAVDISERKELLLQKEKLYIENRLAIDTAKLGLWTLHLDTGELIWNDRMLEIFGLSDDEFSGDLDAWKMQVHPEDLERVEREISKIMRGEAALDLRYRIIRKDNAVRYIEASCSAVRNQSDTIEEVVGIDRDVTEFVESQEKLAAQSAELMDSLLSTVEMASEISTLRDPYTAGHEKRVAEICVAIAEELGCDEDFNLGLKVAAQLHDIGKMGLPSEILTKPGKLTPTEYEYVKSHSQLGYNILNPISFPWPVSDIVLQHHERIDGSGYPNGLKGEEILLAARIMGVADVVEAMASHRPYRAGLGLDVALDEIERGRGSIYDQQVSDACLRIFREKGFVIPV